MSRYGLVFCRSGYVEIEAQSKEDARRLADDIVCVDQVSWDDDWPCVDVYLLEDEE
ncbi:hypothetical protein LJC33_06555 [Eubacteriales bacterium OttesenSCG-928-N13]|nr:hypothetical protein [Eubacteriales bacterium OttesenSCG-928-N13]